MASSAVDLSGCGRFFIAENLSDIADVSHIDLSGIDSLEGSFTTTFSGYRGLKYLDVSGTKVDGVFSGDIVRLISDTRAAHGREAVKLYGCGCFVLAGDISDIADSTSIDLSGVSSLEGYFAVFSSHSNLKHCNFSPLAVPKLPVRTCLVFFRRYPSVKIGWTTIDCRLGRLPTMP